MFLIQKRAKLKGLKKEKKITCNHITQRNTIANILVYNHPSRLSFFESMRARVHTKCIYTRTPTQAQAHMHTHTHKNTVLIKSCHINFL